VPVVAAGEAIAPFPLNFELWKSCRKIFVLVGNFRGKKMKKWAENSPF